MAASSNDNLTATLLHRRALKKRPARKIVAAPPRRHVRTMAMDPFFIMTVVLLAFGFASQFFLIFWLEF